MAVTATLAASQPTCKHILVVDDDASIRVLLRTFFEKIGYLVTVTSSGLEALRCFQESKEDRAIDIVLLDMTMPDMNGIQVCQNLRKESDVPVLILSGVDEDEELLAKAGVEKGDFIQKPFSVREVEARVKGVLQQTY
ncbi:MAG: response regulator [Chloroflexota bacterium]